MSATGYVLLMFTARLQLGDPSILKGCSLRHFSWLYGAYLVMMLVCSIPALFLLREGSEMRPNTQTRRGKRTSSGFERPGG